MTSYQQQLPRLSTQCQCACGTRLSLDQQLLNQRQQWKDKYYCLQKQTTKDIGLLKQKIYQQCSTLMHSQFLSKQKNHANIVNAKNVQIQQLTSRVIKLQTAWKISEKQKQVLNKRLEQQEKRFSQKLQELSDIKDNYLKKLNNLQQQNLTETGILKVKITEDYQTKIEKLEKQNQHLRHKINQFQKKYMAIIPQVQKLKNIITKKTSEVQGLQQQRQKIKQTHFKEITVLKQKLQDVTSLHSPCLNQITQLSQKISSLQNQLAKAKIVKKEIKVQPVYVDRPVEVERVVERLIEVERIVKQYIEPSQDYRQLEQDNKKMRLQLESIIQELKLFENRYESTLHEHQQTIRQYQQNVSKYKVQRQNLVKRIHEQDQQLQKILQMINTQTGRQCSSGEPERIVVQVNKDGTVNKRIQKIGIDERVKATVGKLPSGGKQTEYLKQTEQQLKNSTTGHRATRVTTQLPSKKR